MSLWFSADLETGLPPEIEHVRACWLLTPSEPAPPAGVDLVFPVKERNNRDKRIPLLMADSLASAPGSVLSCPSYTTGVNCQDCGFCWRGPNLGVAENYNDAKTVKD
jgi:hypothetical protein